MIFRKRAHQGGIAERKQMINPEHDLAISCQAKLLDISRSSVYYVPRAISETDLKLMRRLDELHLEHPFMGARMLKRELAKEGIEMGRRHIGTLMRRLNIEAMAPKPGTSKPRLGHTIYPYLLRHVSVTQANQVWALDTTYIADGERLCLFDGGDRCGQPPGAHTQAGSNLGGLSRGRDHGSGFRPIRHVRYCEHRSG